LEVKNFLGVYGHVIIDYIIEVPKLPEPNTSIQIDESKTFFGGTGANLARLASHMGVKTALASFVGQDFPNEYFKVLKKGRVDITELKRIDRYGTPKAWIFSDKQGNQCAIVDQGPMKKIKNLPLLTRAAKQSNWVHFGTGKPEYYLKIVRMAVDENRMVAIDPSQEIHYVYNAQNLRKMMNYSDIFFGNESEVTKASKMLRVDGVKGLLRRVPTVVETKGASGSFVHEFDGTTKIPAIKPSKIVDYTGAGDAYRAGFYAGLNHDLDYVRCAALGSSVASFVLEVVGTQTILPTYRKVFTRAKRTGLF